MGEAVEKLTGLLHSGLAYDISYAEVRETQIAAMNERLQEQPGKIKLLKLRAEEAGISEIRSLEDAVPLLLPHTAYKSYPESFLSEQKWDRLTRWLGTVSANPTDNTELDGIADIDEWVSRLGAAGHYVSCSSGTSGKPSMLVATKADMERATEDSVVAFSWGSGVAQKQDHRMFGLAPIAAVPRNEAIGMGLYHAFADPAFPRFAYPVPPITVGSITKMVTLRKAIADGSAQPSEIADFDATSAMRQKAMDDATGICADALIAARGERLYISGMWASLYKIAEEVSKRGYSSKDFTGDNTMYVGGGLKGATVPDNYREVIYETFNLKPERNFMMYGMQEIGSAMPRCQQAGRYHIPPWLVCMPLNQDGDALVPIGANGAAGEVEGRAAFFDLSMAGRWGGVISGDKIEVDFSPCACGAQTPSIRDNIMRYSDLQGDDKIACSGTVDAYVRGLA